jgi:hypothetical protein
MQNAKSARFLHVSTPELGQLILVLNSMPIPRMKTSCVVSVLSSVVIESQWKLAAYIFKLSSTLCASS